ncbi:MAG TPA: ATP-binding cassette domain-containing protein [Planctomycetota bacterium]|nr:ATP-binding cassette domain-containing protein [Planctomycetota bacterium]
MMASQALLNVQSLSKFYRKRCVVDKVSLRVDRGEVVGLFGRYGAGKTTLLQMLIGTIKPFEGTIEASGEPMATLPAYKRARKGMAFVQHEGSVFRGLTVEENLLAVNPKCPARRLLADFDLTPLARRKAGTLKGGEWRRLELCRAMVGAPSLLLLDEPFSGVDPREVGVLQGLIRGMPLRGVSVLFSDHNLRESLPLCDRAYILHEGRILKEGTPPEIERPR